MLTDLTATVRTSVLIRLTLSYANVPLNFLLCVLDLIFLRRKQKFPTTVYIQIFLLLLILKVFCEFYGAYWKINYENNQQDATT
jgi:hypothetical protein